MSTPRPTASRAFLWVARLLAPVAAGIAWYLFSQGGGGGVAGCDGIAGFDCSAALESRWATWLGLPVSLIGAVCYTGLAAGAWLVGSRSMTLDAAGWRVLELLTPAAIGAAVWFVGLQLTGAAPACAFCLAIHGCGAVIAAAVLVTRQKAGGAETLRQLSPIGAPREAAADQPLPPPQLGLPTLGGIVTVAALVVVQVMLPPQMRVLEAAAFEGEFQLVSGESTPPSPTIESAETEAQPAESSPEASTASKPRRKIGGSRIVSLLGGKLKFDAYELPILGSPEAPTVIVELMNYGCPHCRQFAPILEEARARYGDQLAVIVLPIPTEKECNKYVARTVPGARGTCKIAQLAAAAAKVAPEEFERVHHFLLEGDTMPNLISSSVYAKETIDPERLSEMILSDAPKQQVADFVELYVKLSRRRGLKLPSQIIGDKILEGPANSVDELCKAWEEHTSLRPTGATN